MIYIIVLVVKSIPSGSTSPTGERGRSPGATVGGGAFQLCVPKAHCVGLTGGAGWLAGSGGAAAVALLRAAVAKLMGSSTSGTVGIPQP